MADITSAHLAELRAVAEAATPGPWVFDPPGMWGDGDDIPQSAVRQIDAGSITWDDHGGEVFKPEDAAHVATFDPPTVLALIAALEGLSTTNEHMIAYARKAEAALERVRALHRKAHAIFSWSEGGVRYEEPCENCNGAPGVHDCGCWADVQVEYVCAECDRDKGKHRDSGWPCPTAQALTMKED